MKGLFAGFVVLATLFAVVCGSSTHEYAYGILIDAGSSGSRLYIYQWLKRTDTGLPDLTTAPINQTQWSFRVTPGLSTFANNIAGIQAYLTPLISFAHSKINASYAHSTPLYLKATGGLRALAQSDQDAIMSATRDYFQTTSYNFTRSYAQVITLEWEGFFGWMTVNYLVNKFASPSDTVGALDMGGASTEIAFVPSGFPTVNNFTVILDGNHYDVYAGGYSARGQDAAGALVLSALAAEAGYVNFKSPCYLVGYTETVNIASPTGSISLNVTGTGDSTACRALARRVLLNTSAPCDYDNCGFNGVYQPAVRGQFYAYSGFYYTFSMWFAPNTQISLTQFDEASQNFCSLNMATAQSIYNTTALNFLKVYCFTSSYFIELFDVYGFAPDTTDIHFAGFIDGKEVSYALGAILYEANLLPIEIPTTTTTTGSTTTGSTTTTTGGSTTTAGSTTTTAVGSTSTTAESPVSTTSGASAVVFSFFAVFVALFVILF